MSLLSLSGYLQESRIAKQQAHVRVDGESLRRSRSLGVHSRAAGRAPDTSRERAPVHAHCADHHSSNIHHNPPAIHSLRHSTRPKNSPRNTTTAIHACYRLDSPACHAKLLSSFLFFVDLEAFLLKAAIFEVAVRRLDSECRVHLCRPSHINHECALQYPGSA